tara:strand:+ start:940 stop:1311 length:372 start_codon:yes stop_codon:yes gene_type:complete
MELRKIAFGILLFGVILNMAIFATASVGLDGALGVSGSTDPSFMENIDDAMDNLEVSTNSFEVFKATIQIAQVLKNSFLDLLFVVPQLMVNLGFPTWVSSMFQTVFSILYIAAFVYIIIGRSI